VLGNGQIVSQTRGGTTSYFLADAQGSTRALTNSSGAITDSFNYTAFGELLNQPATLPTNYLYTGQQFDSATSLYSLRARYYNPASGRFNSRDMWPYNLQNPVELNRYAYAAGNPVRWSDPSGNQTIFTYAVNSFRATLQSVGLKRLLASGLEGGVSGLLGFLVGNVWGSFIGDGLSGRPIDPFHLEIPREEAILSFIFGFFSGITHSIIEFEIPPSARSHIMGILVKEREITQAISDFLLTNMDSAIASLIQFRSDILGSYTVNELASSLAELASDIMINVLYYAFVHVGNTALGSVITIDVTQNLPNVKIFGFLRPKELASGLIWGLASAIPAGLDNAYEPIRRE
jgi:RHS repeat-associated protein